MKYCCYESWHCLFWYMTMTYSRVIKCLCKRINLTKIRLRNKSKRYSITRAMVVRWISSTFSTILQSKKKSLLKHIILQIYECIVARDLFEHMIEEGCVIAIITFKSRSHRRSCYMYTFTLTCTSSCYIMHTNFIISMWHHNEHTIW